MTTKNEVQLDDPRLDRNTLLFAAGMLRGASERIGGSGKRLLQELHDTLIAEVKRRRDAESRPPLAAEVSP